MSTTLKTYDNTAPECKYSGDWFLNGTWQASDGDSGTLSSTNNQDASVMFTFPVPAVAFRYFGMKRSRGGKYGICVDCDPNNLAFKPIDAFDPTDNGENPSSILFQQTFSTPSVHVIIIHNEPDDRGTPNGNSQLTLDRFELDVPVTPASTDVVVHTTTAVVQPPTGGSNDNRTSQRGTTVTTTPPTTTSSDQTSSSAVASPTSAASSSPTSGSNTGANQTSPSTTDSAFTPSSSTVFSSGTNSNGVSSSSDITSPTLLPSHKTPLGAIVGSAVGGLAVIALIIIFIFWRRMRRQSASNLMSVRPLDMASTTVTPPTTVANAVQPGWATGHGVGTVEKGDRPQQVSFSSRPSDSPVSPHPSSNRGRLPRSPSPATASDSFSGALANTNADSSSASNNPRRPPGRARREQDAGPVPQNLLDDDDNNDGETLPPDYRQVFNDRMSGRASQRPRPAPSSPPPPPPLPTSTVEGSRPPQ